MDDGAATSAGHDADDGPEGRSEGRPEGHSEVGENVDPGDVAHVASIDPGRVAHGDTAPPSANSPAAGAAAATPGLDCACAIGPCPAWASITEDRWPATQMQARGSLRDPQAYEPTFEEHHPDGTRYDSPNAPIAMHFFPYNRADLWQCKVCQRHLMRYTEFGGYYVDHRVRVVDAALVIDA